MYNIFLMEQEKGILNIIENGKDKVKDKLFSKKNYNIYYFFKWERK